MTHGEKRDQVAGSESSLAEAIAALAKAIAPKPEGPSRFRVGHFTKGVAETLLPSAVMFALGFVFIQGVELDLKRQQFTASSAEQLRSYVETLIEPPGEMTVPERQAIALALGGFGGVAAYPLVSIIEQGGAQQIDAAKLGLEQAGRIAPGFSCPIIASVIDDPTGAYSWQTRKAVSAVAGSVGCGETEGPLRRLRGGIGKFDGLTTEQRNNLKATVDQALSRVEAASERRGWW